MEPSLNDLYAELVFRNDITQLVAISNKYRNSNGTSTFRQHHYQQRCHYDNEEQLYETLLMALFGRHYQMNVPYLVAVVCFGFVTNLLNLVVLTRLRMRNSINVLLAALALSDLMVLSVEIPGILQYYHFHQLTSKLWVVAFAYLQAIRFMSRVLSNGLTVTVGSWRCLAVTWPLRAKEWCSVKRAWLAISCVAICAVVLAVPVYFSIVHISCIFNATSVEGAPSEHKIAYINVLNEDLGLNSTVLGAFVISVTYLPCLALSAVTFCLIRSLFQANSKRKLLRIQSSVLKKSRFSSNGFRPKDHLQHRDTRTCTCTKDGPCENSSLGGGKKLTLMLLIVLVLFVVNNMPSAVAVTAALISRDAAYASQDFTFILDMFTVLDNSLSFLAYVIMSRKFRQTFLGLVGLGRCFPRSREVSVHTCKNQPVATISYNGSFSLSKPTTELRSFN